MASSDNEDEDLKRAIAMSLNQDQATGSDAKSPGTKTTSTLADILGTDRRAMEEERLARVARKRERSVSPPPFRGSRKAPKLEAKTTVLPSGAVLRSFSTVVTNDQTGRKSYAANAANQQLKAPRSPPTVNEETDGSEVPQSNAPTQGILKYPSGVVKKTWAFNFNRTGHDVKLEEVLEPLTLRTAVLSAFQWDSDWVLSKLKIPPEGRTKCLFIMQAKEEQQKQDMLATAEEAKSWLRLCFPPMDGLIYCMHSKLMLLFHPDKLRVAIPTANLLNFDWGETGVMENSVFMIDLPRLADGSKCELDDMTDFGKEMLHYLSLQGLARDVRDGVRNFDFSATQQMAFVHTAGGTHYGQNMNRTGLTGLARAVRQLHLETDEDLEIDFAASSIGSLDEEQVEKLHTAARGIDLVEREKAKNSEAKANFFKASSSPKKSSTSRPMREKIRIYFPTHQTVTSSLAGAAGTICLNRKYFEKPAFPRAIFRDYKSTRTGLLSHNKILYARGKQTQEDGSKKDIAWAYVGSANMSESAWGKISWDAKNKAWKIGCRNWECGAVLPVSAEKIEAWRETQSGVDMKEEDDSATEDEDEAEVKRARKVSEQLIGMEVFDDIVKPPFEMPGEKYNGREPWYFMENNT